MASTYDSVDCSTLSQLALEADMTWPMLLQGLDYSHTSYQLSSPPRLLGLGASLPYPLT